MSVTVTVNTKSVLDGLDNLHGVLRDSLARSMAVAGGKIIRDEAKARAPFKSGKLRNAIYLAYKESRSVGNQQVYSVSWNSRHIGGAPHGHLLEFGHWKIYVSYIGSDGNWYTDTSKPLDSPKWIAAHAFLRPALEATRGRATQAMLARARVRLPELLNGAGNES